MKNFLTFAIQTLVLTGLMAQTTFPVNGVHEERDEIFAFTGATIFKNYNTKIITSNNHLYLQRFWRKLQTLFFTIYYLKN